MGSHKMGVDNADLVYESGHDAHDAHSAAASHSTDSHSSHPVDTHSPDSHSVDTHSVDTHSVDGHGTLHGGSSETFLFAGLSTEYPGPFVFACVVLVLVAFVLEMARYYTFKLESKLQKNHAEKLNLVASYQTSYQTPYPAIPINANNDSKTVATEDKQFEVLPIDIQSSTNELELEEKTKEPRELYSWVLLGALYSSSYLVSLLLMLIAMSYNVYLILSVCLGVTLGKLFGFYLKNKKP